VNGATGLALVLAAASSLALNWGFFRQHEQAAGLPALSLRRPLGSLRLLFGNLRWLVGFLVGIGGWALYVAALRFGSLSLVQATAAGGVGILALLVGRAGVELSRREWAGTAVAVLGLVLLGLSLAGSGGSGVGHASWFAVAVWMAGTGAAAAIATRPASRLLAAGAGFGAAAGLCYAAGDVGTKAAVAGGGRLAFVPAVLACHGLGFVLLQLGFQRGGALATAGVATVLTNAVPIAAGMLLFGDPLPGGALGFVRVTAFALVVAGAALLARPGAIDAAAAASFPAPAPTG
jgi:hypothetical protein